MTSSFPRSKAAARVYPSLPVSVSCLLKPAFWRICSSFKVSQILKPQEWIDCTFGVMHPFAIEKFRNPVRLCQPEISFAAAVVNGVASLVYLRTCGHLNVDDGLSINFMHQREEDKRGIKFAGTQDWQHRLRPQ